MTVVRLEQDKIVKHSVRYATGPDAKFPLSVYVPKGMLGANGEQLNGWPKFVWVKISMEEIS